MRFLADENMFPPVVSYLQELGHDVKNLYELDILQATDDSVIDMATKEERTVITFDKHFGDILRYPPRNLSGIILVRIHPPLLDDIFRALQNLFENYHANSFKGKLIVLSKSGYRIR